MIGTISSWIWAVLVVSAVLFMLKLIYALCTALVLPKTQGALYVSTSRVRISAFLGAVTMKPGQLLIDLGCGDGRVLREARRRYGVKGVGYELNPMAYFRARLQSFGTGGIEIRCRNFWNADLSGADVVFCYLFPDVMKKVAAKLSSELKSGVVVVSCNFALPGWCPTQVLRPGSSLHNSPIYIYRIQKT